ncbi:hypothetical protein FHR83_008334 [Actinoplanes campanulatus]|uniref:Uncharacterized protein n=1 Tax=Actinoplanes campanulatus TaxID=113559 RepID=A0A7W5ARN6_9ACTN|nr:hypothetical protein [Actinoplanes campanulatus]MBB3100609.1 hypothetical protein [Actinoplanes campanulatus]GGN45880.1 hypothetical protein GCM10010109_80530 [Actinoplanes campanulatus]GID41068.1 hypothetical protein Aca09nite_75740 [Actinoplanes campanulatus]
MPTLKPTGDVSVGDFGVQAKLGWMLAFTGTVLLMLVAALLVAGRYELLVAGILAVAVTLPAMPAPIWIAVAWLLASIDFDVNLARALSRDGFTLTSRRLGLFAYLFLVAGMVAVPVVSVRAWWTAALRNEPRPWRRHPE